MNNEIKIVDILKLDDEYKKNLRIWRNKDFVRKNMFNQEVITEEQHSRFIENLRKSKDKKIFIAFIQEKPFGVLNYTFFKKDNSLEFGYYLIDDKNVDSGFGVVLEYMLLNYSFEYLKIKKVYCRTFAFNKKVVKLHRKFGFKTENTYLNENFKEVYFQSIFKDEWEDKKEKIKPLVEFFCKTEDIKFIKKDD